MSERGALLHALADVRDADRLHRPVLWRHRHSTILHQLADQFRRFRARHRGLYADADETFRMGLDFLLDGIEARLTR